MPQVEVHQIIRHADVFPVRDLEMTEDSGLSAEVV